jgi:hypothetical protein
MLGVIWSFDVLAGISWVQPANEIIIFQLANPLADMFGSIVAEFS